MTSFVILLAMIAFSPAQTMAKGPGDGGGGGEGHGRSGEGHGGGGGKHSDAVHAGGGGQSGNPHVGVGGSTGVNLGVRSNPGGPGGRGTMSHQVYDAHNRPEFSGGGWESLDNERYRWDNNRWWFWGADNRWMWYGNDGRWQPYGNAYVVQRPILQNFSGGPIKIDNPASNKETLSYTLDGNLYTIQPGYSQEFREDRAWVVQFSRGTNLDEARYGLQSGLYSFTSTDHGWELYRSEFPQTVAPQPSMVAPPPPTAALQPPMAAPTNPSPQ